MGNGQTTTCEKIMRTIDCDCLSYCLPTFIIPAWAMCRTSGEWRTWKSTESFQSTGDIPWVCSRQVMGRQGRDFCLPHAIRPKPTEEPHTVPGCETGTACPIKCCRLLSESADGIIWNEINLENCIMHQVPPKSFTLVYLCWHACVDNRPC